MLVALSPPAAGQAPSGDVNYSKYALFRIPFQTETGPQRLRQVQLYVSTDQGQTWRPEGTAAPDQRYFDYRASADGQFWFSVRTVDLEGRAYPPTIDGVRPGLKVIVDTQPPVVRLRALAPREGEVGVEWEVRDDNLDSASLRLEYRLPGGGEWVPLGGEPAPTGQRFWRPGTNGPVDVRLRARDRADNWGEDKITLTPAGFTGQAQGGISVEAAGVRPPEASLRYVSSTHIGLNYEIKEKGPSGVSAVELWYTQDPGARNWQKGREETGDIHSPFVVDVNGEGLYGFTLIVRSGVGLADRPPQVGDRPQVWVEVDLTKPLVHLGTVEVGRGADKDKLTIHWTATDKNLGRQPITLTYSEQAGGPWKTIAAGIENNGRYIWQMPTDVPFRFLVRVEAVDKAGNSASVDTPGPVIVDLAQPKGIILNVEPAAK
jgi:hypothetical protein